MKKIKLGELITVIFIAIVITLFGAVALFSLPDNDGQPLENFGRLIHSVGESFDAGVNVQGVEVITEDGYWVGPIDTDDFSVSSTGTSTISIGDSTGDGGGCLILTDYNNSASTTYCSATGGTLECSTTPCN